MKIRSGFVSNSSSSSFVVSRVDDCFAKKPKLCLTRVQVRKLKKEGFKLSYAYYPYQVDMVDAKPVLSKDRRFATWAKYVICNQDEVIHFLLKNRMSFMADCHYEHESLIYNGKTDALVIAQNFGKQVQMGGRDKYDFEPFRKTLPVEKTTGMAYLKKYENT